MRISDWSSDVCSSDLEYTMSKVLIVAEHHDGHLNPASARCVSAALALKAESIDVLVLADAPDAVAAQAAKLDGISRVLTIGNAANAAPIAQEIGRAHV